MARNKITTYEKANDRGLLDQPRRDGKKHKNGRVMKERKPLHKRKKAFAAVRKEQPAKDREKDDDIESNDLMKAEDIVAHDKARAEKMAKKEGAPSPKSKKSGIKLSIGKRKRGDEVVAEEA